MAFEDNQINQEKLEILIQSLMESEFSKKEEAESKVTELKMIYTNTDGEDNGFRHLYSGISNILFSAKVEDSDYLNRGMDTLSSNFEMMLGIVNDQDNDYFKKTFRKLYDHVNLELLRVNYNSLINVAQDKKLNILSNQINDKTKELNENSKQRKKEIERILNEALEELRSVQKSNISILAIFAAVIMTFTGGFSFIANSFSGLTDIPLEKLICLASFIGLILVNLLYALMKFIWGIVKTEKDKREIPFGVGTLVAINIVFAIFAILFFVLSSGVDIAAMLP